MLKKLIAGTFVVTASVWMYNLAWQYGLGTFVLLISLLTLTRLIRRASSLVLISEVPLDSPGKPLETGKEKELGAAEDSRTVIVGLDNSVFQRFREKHQVEVIAEEGRQSTDHATLLTSSSTASQSLSRSDKESSFLNRLEESEDVSVSLSETSRSALAKSKEQPRDGVKEPEMELEKSWLGQDDSGESLALKENPVSSNQHLSEMILPVYRTRTETERSSNSGLIDDEVLEKKMDHLFEDARISLSAEENDENERKKENLRELSGEFREAMGPEGWPNECLSRFFQKPGPLVETDGNSRNLLKMATDAAEAGREETNRDDPRNDLSGFEGFRKPSEIGDQDLSNLDEPQNAEDIKPPSLGLFDTNTDMLFGFSDDRSVKENKEQSDYTSIMDELIMALENKQSFSEALPLLEDLMAYKKERGDLVAMDLLYARLERVHHELGNEKNLVQVFEQHLEFKRKLGDRDGEKKLVETLNSFRRQENSSVKRKNHYVGISSATMDDQ